MTDQPSKSIDESAVAGSEAEAPISAQRWFQRRPIPVWIIFALCSLEMLGILVAMADTHYLEAINSGEVSPAHAIVGFLFPLLLFFGGLFLFLMRKAAVFFFGAYFIWGVAKVGFSAPYISYLSLALVAGICIYSLRLTSQAQLR